ncbi:MAG: undecaprenyldiphospho-muramoylpentapeptide beta-N-acetylglucosaminyltransferase [Planctomycetota bacterium]|jgi:UDP-N-acetylglucosamine--N-acetylmuramyl-(pentapeptide) pyrophosphoryl-undecaprenol N-acetylglucosamine transferase|nr:undecaprenyldiphospho-muramoylpentapeptide beta-N-acetylglucosaminyltransferase [Deltaproteobacteria bacterium]MDP6540890.1 undecaprenyldiphospho-muramoylpentapeptide beta-N-acetylglucosaminyltransferase [Planctomycetota bacterium]
MNPREGDVNLRWVISGGGTGGHVTPALALGEVLREDGDDVLFVGTRRGIENRLVPEAGFSLEALDSRPLVARSLFERVAGIVALLWSTWQARRLLARFDADRVIAVGGYASAPAALAAAWRGTPMALVNTDVLPGAANRLLARFARRIFVGFPRATESFGRAADRVEVSGVPLRRALCCAFARPPDPREPGPGRRLFVFGGSQGARQINDAMIAALPSLAKAEPPIDVVHQTGEADRERVNQAYREAGVAAEVVAFESDMPARYRAADLVVCRAGAISIAELALAGRPAVLIPLAHVGGGEQFANARVLEEIGAARSLDSRDLDAQALADTLRALLADDEALAQMGAAAASLARPDAARRIVERCRQLGEEPA